MSWNADFFPRALDAEMKNRKLTRAEFARFLAVPYMTLCQWLDSKHNPFSKPSRAADALGWNLGAGVPALNDHLEQEPTLERVATLRKLLAPLTAGATPATLEGVASDDPRDSWVWFARLEREGLSNPAGVIAALLEHATPANLHLWWFVIRVLDCLLGQDHPLNTPINRNAAHEALRLLSTRPFPEVVRREACCVGSRVFPDDLAPLLSALSDEASLFVSAAAVEGLGRTTVLRPSGASAVLAALRTVDPELPDDFLTDPSRAPAPVWSWIAPWAVAGIRDCNPSDLPSPLGENVATIWSRIRGIETKICHDFCEEHLTEKEAHEIHSLTSLAADIFTNRILRWESLGATGRILGMLRSRGDWETVLKRQPHPLHVIARIAQADGDPVIASKAAYAFARGGGENFRQPRVPAPGVPDPGKTAASIASTSERGSGVLR